MTRRLEIGLAGPLFTTAGITILWAVSGCSHWGDPFVDELAGRPTATTASAVAARAVALEHVGSQRPFQVMPIEAKNGAVTHGTLYYEDPYLAEGSEDDQFAWTQEDYLHWFYGPARFLVETAFYPVKAVRNPPWLVMSSDGRTTERAPRD